ncbi:MAG: glutathione S-transferase family protein [Pseudomonadota bacterium]
MIEFYKFVPQFGLRDASPFCLKLATYLRLAGIPHTTHEIMDPSEAPKQRMPYIREDGEAIGDSELIIAHLKAKFGDPLAEGLTEAQKAIGHAFSVMLAERFGWAAMVYPRWADETKQQLMTETWFGGIPEPMKSNIANGAFEEMACRLNAHGIGLHDDDEISTLGLSDLKAIEDQLGDKQFLLDDRPREVDASVYAFLTNAACEYFDTAMSQYIRNSKPLTEYLKRVDEAAYA